MLEESFDVIRGKGTGNIPQEAQGCHGMIVRVSKITAEVMDALPSLRVIAKHGMGVDNIDVEYATKKGILVLNAPYSNLNAVAEHIVMLILALSKRTVQMDRITRNGGFSKRTSYKNIELQGATLGIIGMGKISSLVAKKLAGFEMNLLANDPAVSQENVNDLHVRMVTQEALLAQADFVLVHTSLTASTFHLIGAEHFHAMKHTAFLINASRGAVVDEAALVAALQSREIAGAGLDVFEEEPPARDHPFFSMENVILSPHNAALTHRALLNMAMDSASGVADYLSGRRPAYPVNLEALERRLRTEAK